MPNGKIEWPALHADLVAKRDALNHVIGVVETHFIGGAPGEMPASPPANKKPAKKTNERTNERTKQGPRRVNGGSHPDDAVIGPQEEGRRQKILTALDDGPLATRELAGVIKVDRKLTKMTLQRMAKVGLLTGVGVGPARRWTLPGKQPAKEGI